MDKKIKIGILAPADIAKRRFIPALSLAENMSFAGIAARSEESAKKAEAVLNECNAEGKVYNGYNEMLSDSSIDAVYIPLPPSLHYEWGKAALNSGKHVFMEKPFCTDENETGELIRLAKEKGLVLYENYGCLFHDQIRIIDELIKDSRIGELSLIRAAFGFLYRGENDFRYSKKMGGGALLDAGGYCMKIARHFMDKTASVKYGSLFYDDKHDCDMFGSVVMEDDNGLTAQLSFGMNNQYKCELELWGTKGMITAPRIFTAPPAFEPEIIITCGTEKEIIKAKATDQFAECINRFSELILNKNNNVIYSVMDEIRTGSSDISEVFRISGN